MSDIVERLRDAARFLDDLEYFPEVQIGAADEITRLREENARLAALSAKASLEALQLREVLMPFVQRLEVLEETIAHKYAIGTDIDVAHLRAARTAIREGETK